VAADWLAAIRGSEQGVCSWITLDLIGHEDSDIEFCADHQWPYF
jgi:hypothetical protein